MASKLYFTILIFFILTTNLLSNELDYHTWLEKFKIRAEKSGISKITIDETVKDLQSLETFLADYHIKMAYSNPLSETEAKMSDFCYKCY